MMLEVPGIEHGDFFLIHPSQVLASYMGSTEQTTFTT